MVSLAGPTPTPWPRIHSGQKNPFQNAPGLFVYSLPNLAGTCPFSLPGTASSVCPFAESAAPNRHHDECYHHPAVASCCSQQQQHPASESAESPSPSPAQQPQPQPPLDESHFDLGDIRSSSLTGGGAEFCTMQQQNQQQKRSSGEPSTPARSRMLSSPMGSDFTEAKELEDEDEKEEEEEEATEKRKRRCRKRRKRTNKGRLPSEHAGCVMGPRMMGFSGLHFDRWTRYVCPDHPPPPPWAPPPPASTNHGAWLVAAGVVPCSGIGPARFWDPPMAVQAVQVPGLVSVPCW